MRPRFIFNPSSGRARDPAAALTELRTAVERWFPGSAVEVTERPGHAEELSRQALTDGCQLVVAVGAVPRWRAPALALRLFAGGFDRHPRVFHRRGAVFRISRAGGGFFHTDGEVWPGSSEWAVKAVPRTLRVRVPI